VTACAGTAHWNPAFAYASDLLTAADAALYEAKRAGRSQVRSWNGAHRSETFSAA